MPIVAQGAERAPFDVATLLAQPCVFPTDGGWIGRGPGFGVRFDARRIEFAGSPAAPGGAVPRLVLEVTTLGRTDPGRSLTAPAARGTLDVEGATVHYRRAEWVESYEVRTDGVAQSFRFDRLPAGSGDLVVRARVTTTLTASASGRDVGALVFESADGSGITIGAVTGIDARGVRAAGTMRFDGEHLDLVLPGPFVARAALPVMLDPLIGTVTVNETRIAQEWDLGYEPTRDVFLVAWTEYGFFSFTTYPVAVRVTPSGAVLGNVISLGGPGSGGVTYDPRVASIASRGVFATATTLCPDLSPCWIGITIVDSATGVVRDRATLTNEHLDDLGGSIDPNDDGAVLLHDSSIALHATRIRVDASGQIDLGTPATLSTYQPGRLVNARVTRSSGPHARHLVGWSEIVDGIADLYGAVLAPDLAVLDLGPLTLTPGPKRRFALDGDGAQWLVAYETSTVPPDIVCTAVFWDSATQQAYLTPDVPIATAPIAETSPEVAWSGGSYLVHHFEQVRGNVLRSLDPFTCLPCEGEFLLGTNSLPTALASTTGQSSTSDMVLLMTEPQKLQVFRVDDGLISELGGGCGRGGRAAASCAIVGNGDFTLRLRDAHPSASAWLLLSPGRRDVPCGACTLVPDLASVLSLSAGITDPFGNSAIRVPLPSQPALVGAAFYLQWIVAPGNGCLGNLDTSSALRVELQ